MTAFIPKLGSMDSVVQGKRNDVEFNTVNIFPSGFDITVIGMQEANTFSSSDTSAKGETEDWARGSAQKVLHKESPKKESPFERGLLYGKSSSSLLENEYIDDKQYMEKKMQKAAFMKKNRMKVMSIMMNQFLGESISLSHKKRWAKK